MDKDKFRERKSWRKRQEKLTDRWKRHKKGETETEEFRELGRKTLRGCEQPREEEMQWGEGVGNREGRGKRWARAPRRGAEAEWSRAKGTHRDGV